MKYYTQPLYLLIDLSGDSVENAYLRKFFGARTFQPSKFLITAHYRKFFHSHSTASNTQPFFRPCIPISSAAALTTRLLQDGFAVLPRNADAVVLQAAGTPPRYFTKLLFLCGKACLHKTPRLPLWASRPWGDAPFFNGSPRTK